MYTLYIRVLKSWHLSVLVEIHNWRALCAYAREQSRVRKAKVPVLLSAIALYMYVYMILWYPGPPVDVVMLRDWEGKLPCFMFRIFRTQDSNTLKYESRETPFPLSIRSVNYNRASEGRRCYCRNVRDE